MSPFPGQQFQEGQAVYPDQDGQQAGVFPDGTPFTRSQNKKSRYVFVWKTWGKYHSFYNNISHNKHNLSSVLTLQDCASGLLIVLLKRTCTCHEAEHVVMAIAE